MTVVDLPILMRKLSIALEELSPQQINGILSNDVRVKIKLVPTREKKIEEAEPADLEKYLAELREMKDRMSGTEMLEGLKKSVLQSLAKKLQLSIDSSLSKEKLTARIVERAIGLRLRQDAFAQLS